MTYLQTFSLGKHLTIREEGWPYRLYLNPRHCICKFCNKDYYISRISSAKFRRLICKDCLLNDVWKIMPIPEEELAKYEKSLKD